MRARIKEKRDVAKGTLLVTLDLLGEELEFTPGQYFHVTLPDLGDNDARGLRRPRPATSPSRAHARAGCPPLAVIIRPARAAWDRWGR